MMRQVSGQVSMFKYDACEWEFRLEFRGSEGAMRVLLWSSPEQAEASMIAECRALSSEYP